MKSGYVLQVKAISWNGTGYDAAGNCCDGYTWRWFEFQCDKSCENSFLFCMRPFGYNRTSEHCPLGSYQTENLGANAIGFKTPLSNGISNPMNFTGSIWRVCSFKIFNAYCVLYVGLFSALCKSDG